MKKHTFLIWSLAVMVPAIAMAADATTTTVDKDASSAVAAHKTEIKKENSK